MKNLKARSQNIIDKRKPITPADYLIGPLSQHAAYPLPGPPPKVDTINPDGTMTKGISKKSNSGK